MVNNVIDKLKFIIRDDRIIDFLKREEYWLEKMVQIKKRFRFNEEVVIHFFDDQNQLAEFLETELPDWVVAAYRDNDILLLDYSLWQGRNIGCFSQIMVHELVHVIVNYKTQGRVPLWLDEGLALYMAEQYKTMLIEPSDKPLVDLYRLGYGDHNFYGISARTVEELIDTYGLDLIIEKLKPEHPFEEDRLLGVEPITSIVKRILT